MSTHQLLDTWQSYKAASLVQMYACISLLCKTFKIKQFL